MSVHRASFQVPTRGRGTVDVTREVNRIVHASAVQDGLCTVFCHHTSASLIITENADPDVRRDLDAFMARLVRDGDALFEHTDEGPDDMASHVRSVLTQTSLGVPVASGQLDLGTWQGIYLWEHRTHPHRRRLSVVVM